MGVLRAAATALLLGLLGATTSCAAPPEASLGSVSIDLIGQAPSGALYRLRHAIITVAGGDVTRTWNTEDAPDQPSLSDDVPAGSYTATLARGWDLERIDPSGGGFATPVMAELTSRNPAAFTVGAAQRTTVPLRFHVETEDVEIGQGFEIVLGVEESPPQLIVVTNLNDFEGGSITVFPVGSRDDVAPLRTIAGPLTTLEEPAGVTVTQDEIVVCDLFGAIDIFPLLANGNVAPARRIAGYATGLDLCFDVAVYNAEIYVVQGNELLVFPLDANGDVPPLRRISGFSSAQNLAIDKDELYLSDRDADSVLVFALPIADGAVPSRVLDVFCPAGLSAGAGELAVVRGCGSRIDIYPQTATGDASPLRSIGGLRSPEGIARFRGRLYVVNSGRDRDSVLIFPAPAPDEPDPSGAIVGPQTGLVNPVGIAVH